MLSYSNAFAWGNRRGYHYDRGRWHRSGWFGFDVVVSTIAVGTVVESLPAGYTTVVVAGMPYYCHNNIYFRSYQPAGYIVVPAPAAVVTAPAAVTVNPYYLPVTKIAEMAKGNLPDSVIISEIQRTHSAYSLNSEIIAYLKQNKVSDQVIDYMMQTGNK